MIAQTVLSACIGGSGTPRFFVAALSAISKLYRKEEDVGKQSATHDEVAVLHGFQSSGSNDTNTGIASTKWSVLITTP